jgi:hypothetical protein
MSKTFTCASCNGTFEKLTPENEAIAELNADFPGFKLEDCDVVCDVCYSEVMPAIDMMVVENITDIITRQIFDECLGQVVEAFRIPDYMLRRQQPEFTILDDLHKNDVIEGTCTVVDGKTIPRITHEDKKP